MVGERVQAAAIMLSGAFMAAAERAPWLFGSRIM
jgi:hypothetical protein